ncbi:MAG: hypothetical protein QM658_04050 [Gordonia sp. (in: high G+C Gram-positive bacteria)]
MTAPTPLALRVFGHAYPEVAEQLGCTADEVRAQVREALDALDFAGVPEQRALLALRRQLLDRLQAEHKQRHANAKDQPE